MIQNEIEHFLIGFENLWLLLDLGLDFTFFGKYRTVFGPVVCKFPDTHFIERLLSIRFVCQGAYCEKARSNFGWYRHGLVIDRL